MKKFLFLVSLFSTLTLTLRAQDTTFNHEIIKIDTNNLTTFVQDFLLSSKQGVFNVDGHYYYGRSIGNFNNFSNAGIGLDKGIILSTGDVSTALGPNNKAGAGVNNSSTMQDNELATLTDGNQYDVTYIEFDFIPTTNMINFSYVFASEEYPEYVGSQFNDVFGFFISGPGIIGEQNMALIPGSNDYVSINNVNQSANSEYYIANDISANNPSAEFIQYDGYTVPLTAEAPVRPFSTYHIKLAIADVMDGMWDSAVFIKANSFESKPLAFDFDFTEGHYQKEIYEDSTLLQISATLPYPAQEDITYHFSYAGDATMGVDYMAPEYFTFHQGDTTASFKIQALGDNQVEGDEQLQLIIDETKDTLTVTIKESTILLGNQTTHSENMVQLTPNPATDVFALPSNLQAKSVEIYSLTGKRVKAFVNDFNRMDISDLPKGLYSLRIQTVDSTLISKLKVE